MQHESSKFFQLSGISQSWVQYFAWAIQWKHMNPKSAKLNLQHENNNIALLPAYSKVLHSSAEFWSVHCESDGVLTNIFNAEQAKYATKMAKYTAYCCILMH